MEGGVMWTDGVERFPDVNGMTDALYSSIKANTKAYDEFGMWVNDMFTAWDAVNMDELAHRSGVSPIYGMFSLWMKELVIRSPEMLWELFGIKEVSE